MKNRVSPFDRLETQRGHYKLTKKQWAARLDISPATYNHWRVRGVPAKAIQHLMAKTGLSYAELIDTDTPADPLKMLDRALQDLLIVGVEKDDVIADIQERSARAHLQFQAFKDRFKKKDGGEK